jgi:putative transposase
VTSGLIRYYGTKNLHFITGSCYKRRPELGSPQHRDLFLKILEQTRRKYQFVVHGYVVMPEHFHLLITEPEKRDPSIVMKVIKERFTRQVNKERRLSLPSQSVRETTLIWQKRFYDFNVWSERKHVEKLRYIHRNPVKRGLVSRPEDWMWSSYRSYFYGEPGLVRVNFQEWKLEIKRVPLERFSGDS